MNQTPQQRKAQLRIQAIRQRQSIPDGVASAYAARINGHLLSSRLFTNNSKVAAYLPVRSEVDLTDLMQGFAMRGLTSLLPVVTQHGQHLQFYAWKPGEPLEKDAYDIPIPAQRTVHMIPDIVLVPLLAFDNKGCRLGYGGGYYDRTLHHLRHNHSVLAIGVAFASQELSDIPVASHDEKLDMVVTETGIRDFR